jgi:hypothetical protein
LPLRRSGGGPAPALIQTPAIFGALAEGSELELDIGLWSGATSFEIVVTDSDDTVLLARQSVTGATTGTLDTVVGTTLTLTVWATGPGGTVSAQSDPFGPIEAAGDEWIVGLVFNADTAAISISQTAECSAETCAVCSANE